MAASWSDHTHNSSAARRDHKVVMTWSLSARSWAILCGHATKFRLACPRHLQGIRASVHRAHSQRSGLPVGQVASGSARIATAFGFQVTSPSVGSSFAYGLDDTRRALILSNTDCTFIQNRRTASVRIFQLFSYTTMWRSPVVTQQHPETKAPPYYRYSWAVLLTVAFAYLLDVFMRFNIPTVIPQLMEEYHWDPVLVGWVDSSYLWTYAIMQVPWAIISERWLGMRKTVLTGTILITGASILFAFQVDNVAIAIVARALIGVGSAAVWVPAYPAISRWFAPSKRGVMTGVFGAAGNVGTFLGSAAMPILLVSAPLVFGLSQIGSGFLWSAIPGIVAIVLVIVFAKNRPEDIGKASLDNDLQMEPGEHASPAGPTLTWAITHSVYPWLLCLLYAAALWTLYITVTWFPAFLANSYDESHTTIGIAFGLATAVGGVLGVLTAGAVSDRISKKTTTSLAFAGSTVTGVVVVIMTANVGSISFIAAIGILTIFYFFAAMWTLVWPFTSIMFPTSVGAGIGGMMNTAAQLAAAASPVVAGWVLAQTGSYPNVFALSVVGAVLALILSRFLKTELVIKVDLSKSTPATTKGN